MNDMFLPTGCAISGVNPTFISFDANGNLLILRRKALLNGSMTKINNLQYTYSYRGLASAAHSTYHYAIGNSINLSQISSTSTGGYVISGSYYRTASGAPTTVNGTSGNFAAYYVGGDGSENVKKRHASAFDIAGGIVGGLGLLNDLGNYGWHNSSNKQQWRASHNLNKALKSRGFNVKTSAIKNSLPNAFKATGVGLGVVSGTIAVADVLYNSEIKASHVLDATITGVSFIPVVGWVIGGSYFVSDMVHRGVYGYSIGDRLNNSVGEPLYDWNW